MDEWRPWQVENVRYFGKHECYEPVHAGGYRFDAAYCGNVQTVPAGWYPIIRAIQAEGRVDRLSWNQSPQVKFWLDEPKKTLLQRFLDWLRG